MVTDGEEEGQRHSGAVVEREREAMRVPSRERKRERLR
jgi:hypothetical protein